MKSMNHSIFLALSLHGYGRSILHPYSCQKQALSLNASILTVFDYSIREFLQGIHYKYTTGQSWKVPGLYSVNGDAVDYLYSRYSIPSFSVEVILEESLYTSYLQRILNFEKLMVSGLQFHHYGMNAINY